MARYGGKPGKVEWPAPVSWSRGCESKGWVAGLLEGPLCCFRSSAPKLADPAGIRGATWRQALSGMVKAKRIFREATAYAFIRRRYSQMGLATCADRHKSLVHLYGNTP